ncbi:MAG: RNA polymerase sigma factor, partial [Bacteroidia bacterium]
PLLLIKTAFLHTDKPSILQSSQPNEKELIIAAQSNPERFAPLYDHWYNPVFLFVFKRINDKEITADLTSQVFLKALVAIKNYKFTGAPFSAWLFRIAVNEVNMYFRKNNKNATVPLNEDDLRQLTEEVGEDETEENYNLLADALNELPEEQTQLIELRFFDKNSFLDMAQILGLTEAGTKMKLYRVLEKLKNSITLKRQRKQ